MRRRILTLLVGAVGLVGGSIATPAPVTAQSASYAVPGRPAVVEAKVIGRSVTGRAIVAYRVGDPESTNKVVAMSTMHGNESRTRRILASIRDGRPVNGIDLWLIPVVNPDGLGEAPLLGRGSNRCRVNVVRRAPAAAGEAR